MTTAITHRIFSTISRSFSPAKRQ